MNGTCSKMQATAKMVDGAISLRKKKKLQQTVFPLSLPLFLPMRFADGLEQVVRRVVDSRNNLSKTLSVSSPANSNSVELVVRLELADIRTDLQKRGEGLLEKKTSTASLFSIPCRDVLVCFRQE